MKKDEYLIYINWDGFGRYYYDIANSDTYKGTTNLNSLIKEGVFFEKLYTGIPSITYPMQSAIVSGSYSEHTENVYKYYSKEEKKLILCRRKNSAETIGQVLYRENIPFVSVQQFALLEKGAQWDEKNRLYIQPEGDYKNRFKELFKLLEGKEIISKDKAFSYEELPRVIFLYIDDLDSIGHNQLYKRGKLRAFTEKGRIKKVVSRLLQMDKMLGELIDKLKALNIYDKTTILLTTDHGMVPYKGKSCFDAISQALKAIGYASAKALDKEGQQGELEENEVIAVSAGVQLQLYFKDSRKNKLEEIKKALQKEEYVETVLTKYDLTERGTAEFFADILVSPKPPYHFNLGEKNSFLLGGAHDSLNHKAQHIFGVLKGNYFKQNYKCMEKVNNIDFIPTICAALNLPLPANSRGKILNSILK